MQILPVMQYARSVYLDMNTEADILNIARNAGLEVLFPFVLAVSELRNEFSTMLKRCGNRLGPGTRSIYPPR